MKNVEDFYPLSPIQQGILFHTLYEPTSGIYCEQFSCKIHGELKITVFIRCWQHSIERHPVLRTTFLWEDIKEPVQVVHKEVRVPWEQQDWRDLTNIEQQERIKILLRTDRKRGFELSQAPLMRFTLIQLTENDYQFIWSHHHLLLDGWSSSLLLNEVFTYYKAFDQSYDLHLEHPRPYRNYIAWLQQQDLSESKRFWQQRLKGFTEVTPFRVDQKLNHLLNQDNKYDQQLLKLSTTETTALQFLASQQQLTLNTLLQGAWAILLSRYSGEKDVVFGAIVSGRSPSLTGTELMVGVFINTLPVRVYVDPEESILPWLKQLQAQQNEARQYEYSPLIEIQKWSDIRAGQPLFESILNFQNYPINFSSQQISNVKISDIDTYAHSHYPLTVSVKVASELSLEIVYDCDRFDKSTITRMLKHFQTLLLDIIANPEQRITNLSLLTVLERQQQLVEWNNTQTDYLQDKCIHELFEAQVECTPDAVAVVFDDEQLTYRELNTRANQLAHHLQRQGVGPEVCVSICVERSLLMVIGLLGILKAGGIYVPLEPASPPERLTFMLSDTQAQVLLTQQRLMTKLPQQRVQVICLDSQWDIIAEESDRNPCQQAKGENLAYAIYTSGSTGKPKGVLISHNSIAYHCRNIQNYYALDSSDRVLQFASLNFDASLEQIFTTLIAGAKLFLRGTDVWTTAEFNKKLLKYGLTVINLPPAYWQQLTQEWANAPELILNHQLKLVLVGGDKMLPEGLMLWHQTAAHSVRLLNVYGPTEATITATSFEIPNRFLENRFLKRIPIGRPLNNRTLYILDIHDNLVPIGVPGEVHIGGVGLSRGYLNRPDLTALKFIPNPFSNQPGARLYKTGDLACYLPDGNIEYFGRLDDQVKLRGFRIELGEIEAVLGQHPAVRDTVVMLSEDVSGSKYLAAYIVPEQTNQIELWPSVGEYPIYDELLYYAMTNDERRNHSYKTAINQLVKDKVVVEIGTGKDAILSRFCVEGGAKKVYAIEINEEAYRLAEACVQSLALSDKITLIYGDATLVNLPELADLCVSEIIGTIGSSEGVSVILNNARRFLKPDGAMIPQRSITKIAAACLPDELLHNPGFTEVSGYYAHKVFDLVGNPFDLRLCVKNFPQSNLISNVEIFEDLDFTKTLDTEYCHEVNFTINKDARLDGFLLWLNLHTIEGEVIDVLKHVYSWLPVYFPVFSPGIEVSAGDTIQAFCLGTLCENNINPDYKLKGRLIKKNGEVINFEYESYYQKKLFKQTPFYEKLFAQDDIRINQNSRPEALKHYLRERLPEYMVPSVFVMLSALPLTSSGKVDRRALPVSDTTQSALSGAYVAPRTPVEEMLVSIWTEVLGLKIVGIQDNFFELGGHSLLATQLISRVRTTLKVELPLRSLFENPTVSELAVYVETTLRGGLSMNAPPLLPVVRNGNMPLSHAQARLWFLNQLEPNSDFYNIPTAVRLTGRLNIVALKQSLNEIVRRHEVLRTNFAISPGGLLEGKSSPCASATEQSFEGELESRMRCAIADGQPVQVIHSAPNSTLSVIDLREIGVTNQEAQVRHLAMEVTQKPFNLSSDPLLRMLLLQLDEEEQILLVVMHHIITDGWSLGVFVRELGILYESFCTKKPPLLPELPIQYADFALWQRQWLQGEVLESKLSYWRRQLADLPVLQLPTDLPRPAVQTFRGAMQSLVLPNVLSNAIKTLSYQEGVTLFMMLLAAFQTLLHWYTAQDDIVVGIDVANRNRTETENLIGFFVNQLVLRTDLSGNPTFRDLLQRVRQKTLESYVHQDLPFDELVKALNPKRSLKHNPLFQVMFGLDNAPMPPLELSGITLSPLKLNYETSVFDLSLYMMETEQGLIGSLRYNTDLFEPATMTRMLKHFEILLHHVVTQPNVKLDTLGKMLAETDKQEQIIKQKEFREASRRKLKNVKQKPITADFK